jgi:DNA-binding transcriptional ArsR family regulator
MGKDFSVIGRALAAPVRSAFVNMLMDGSQRPASELAMSAGVNASTASEHLSVLMDAGLLQCEARGRQRFYRLADPSVAAALEQLGHLCPPTPTIRYRQTREAQDLAHARFCYDHLAGLLGVELLAAMKRKSWLRDEGLSMTDAGQQAFLALGINSTSFTSKRPLTRPCPDWTERRSHLAGSLGASLAQLFVDRGWVRRRESGRGLDVSRDGIEVLQNVWGVSLERGQEPLSVH